MKRQLKQRIPSQMEKDGRIFADAPAIRRGDEIVLRDKQQSLGKTLADSLADLPPLTAAKSAQLAAAIAAGRDTRAPQARDFSLMAEPAARTTMRPQCAPSHEAN